MARINIEESLYTEPHFLKLIAKTGNEYTALGMVFSLFKLAQKNWLEYRCIPKEKWNKDLDILIELGFATITDEQGSVYVKGSQKSFAWLDRNSQAGKSKSPSKLKHLIQNTEPTPNLARTYAELPSSLLFTHTQQPEKEKNIYTKKEILLAWEKWCNSLNKHGIPGANMSPSQEIIIVRSFNLNGVDDTLDAIEGYGLETSTNAFKPKNYASLGYVLVKNLKTGKSNVERLANLARAARLVNNATISNDEAEHLAIHGRSS